MKPVIGIFDSGIGGRSIENEIKKLLPKVKTIYLKDSKNFPYGDKTPTQIKKISKANVDYLLKKGADLVVVACNTATVQAMPHLRKTFPRVDIVGVEPAVKPAGELSQKGIIILSSPKATKSLQLKKLINKYVRGQKVFNLGSLQLVEAIENGKSEKEILRIFKNELPKNILSRADVLVLGCTHFPLVKKTIQKFVGQKIKVIDSGEAVAKRVRHLLKLRQSKQ